MKHIRLGLSVTICGLYMYKTLPFSYTWVTFSVEYMSIPIPTLYLQFCPNIWFVCVLFRLPSLSMMWILKLVQRYTCFAGGLCRHFQGYCLNFGLRWEFRSSWLKVIWSNYLFTHRGFSYRTIFSFLMLWKYRYCKLDIGSESQILQIIQILQNRCLFMGLQFKIPNSIFRKPKSEKPKS